MKNIYKVNDNKFKSIYISYNFTFETKKEEVPKNVITSLVLSKGCNKYKTSKEIEEYLSSLYGINFDINMEKIGDLYNIEFRLECVNKEFLPNKEDVLKPAIDFLYEIIYNPKIENNEFDSVIFEREKKLVLDKINKRKDEKLKYAVLKTEELLCNQEPFGTYIYGEVNDAENVKLEDIYIQYANLLEKSFVSIVISGNLNGYDDIEQYIDNVFKNELDKAIFNEELINISHKNIDFTTKIKEVKEKIQTNQAVITIGMRVENLEDNDFYALNVYNSILGGTPSSKLFQNVREKESLAYTARSRYYRFKGVFIIYAGIEEINYEKAKIVILKQIDEMKNGNISESELNSSKESLISDLLEWNDSKISLAKLAYTNAISGKSLTIEELIDNMKKVQLEDVAKVAKKIRIELIYLLGGEDSEK
ncbi:MAG: pitrilysin family protein [Clostridia bacterium]|nr:pitrilysin family protein [Clostridia bacterium]MDD4386317.1 pitrilysin family protein [Clostridia bacterium]